MFVSNGFRSAKWKEMFLEHKIEHERQILCLFIFEYLLFFSIDFVVVTVTLSLCSCNCN